MPNLHTPCISSGTVTQLLAQSAPVCHNVFGEEMFPNTQSKPSMTQLRALSSHSVTGYLATPSSQALVESNKVPPEPPFHEAKHLQFHQLFLIQLVLQTLPQICLPFSGRDSCSEGQKLSTEIKVQAHQCWVQEERTSLVLLAERNALHDHVLNLVLSWHPAQQY